MQTKIEKLERSKVKLEIEVSAKQMADFLVQAYEKMAAKVEVKGFRSGKAPKSMVIDKIGHSRLLQETLDIALPQTYYLALKNNNLIPAGSPSVNVKKNLEFDGEDFNSVSKLIYEVELDTLPKIKLPDLKTIKVSHEAEKIEVTEKEVETVLEHLRRQAATHKKMERKAKAGDRVEIEFEGFVDGKKIETLCSKNYPIILGSGLLLPDFEKQLEGLETGQEKEFEIDVPKPASPAGGSGQPISTDASKDSSQIVQKQKAKFKVKVLGVAEIILPNVDEKMAASFGAKNASDLKTKIRADLVKQKQDSTKNQIRGRVLEAIAKKIEIEIPQSLISKELERLKANLQQTLQLQRIDFKQYLQKIGKSETEFEQFLNQQAEMNAKIGLILGEVAKEQKIDIKDKEAAEKAIEYLVKQVGNK